MTSPPLVFLRSQAAPIACTLTGDQLGERASELRRLADRALVSRRPIETGERLRFTDGTGVERALREAVSAEASCCPFLTLIVRRSAGALELDVTGPPEAQAIIAGLFA